MCMTWNQSFAVKMLPCKASVKLLLNCCFINYHLSITLWPHFQYSPRWKPISLSSSQLLTFDPGSPYPSSLLLQDWTLSYSGSLPLFFILSNFCFVFFHQLQDVLIQLQGNANFLPVFLQELEQTWTLLLNTASLLATRSDLAAEACNSCEVNEWSNVWLK